MSLGSSIRRRLVPCDGTENAGPLGEYRSIGIRSSSMSDPGRDRSCLVGVEFGVRKTGSSPMSISGRGAKDLRDGEGEYVGGMKLSSKESSSGRGDISKGGEGGGVIEGIEGVTLGMGVSGGSSNISVDGGK
jgi:hypothetical protein